MENKIYLFDTTLRDGQQTTGVNFTVSDKMIIANALDELGVDSWTAILAILLYYKHIIFKLISILNKLELTERKL